MHKTVSIGLAISYSYAYYRGVMSGIRGYAETRPNWLFSFVVPGERTSGRRRKSHVDGIVASVNTLPLARACARWRGPLVNVSAVLPGLRFPRVGVDNLAVGRLAATHFLECGLRHFAFVGHPERVFSLEREQGFSRALEHAGFGLQVFHSTMEGYMDPAARHRLLDDAVLDWLQQLPKPVGIFMPNDFWGLQVTEACRHAGLRVPDEVALLGVDDDDLHCDLSRPRLSSIRLPTHQVGVEAAALLERLMAGKRPPKQPILLAPLGVTVRPSTDVLALDDVDLVAAVRFIRNHAHEPIRVKDVLRHVPVSRRSLERRFRAALGRGVSEEVRRVHVERAKRLLAETSLPISIVAVQAGFTDFRHLAVTLRQEIGMSPMTYRRSVHSID
jgi:LacI family transcriptional regulator